MLAVHAVSFDAQSTTPVPDQMAVMQSVSGVQVDSAAVVARIDLHPEPDGQKYTENGTLYQGHSPAAIGLNRARERVDSP